MDAMTKREERKVCPCGDYEVCPTPNNPNCARLREPSATSAEREEAAKQCEKVARCIYIAVEKAVADDVAAACNSAARLLRAQPDDEESAVIAAAKVIAASPLIDAPKLGEESWRGLARAILRAARPQS
jgi:hypothetical protein